MTLPPLSPEQRLRPPFFELRISLMFAAVFAPVGIYTAYFPLWLKTAQYSPEQIAVVLSVPMFVRVATTPFITTFADRAKDRADVMAIMVAATLVLACGYLLHPGYGLVVALSAALQIFWTPHSPITDSLALSGVRRFGSNYASMRLWGSSAFLAGSLGGGFILSHTGPSAVPLLMVGLFCVTLAATLFLPRLGPPRRAVPGSDGASGGQPPRLLSRYFLLFIVGTGIINSSHGFMYGFTSIYWDSIGLSETVVGLLWSFAVLAEIGMFFLFTRAFRQVSPLRLMVFSGLACVARWALFPLIWPSGVGLTGFFAVQALHAITTGFVLLATQRLIADTVSEDRTGAAQGAAFFANGFAMAIVMLLSGPLYERLGADGFYVMCGVAIAGLGVLWLAASSAPQLPVRR